MLLAEKQTITENYALKQNNQLTSRKSRTRVKGQQLMAMKICGIVFCLVVVNVVLQAMVIQKNYEVSTWESKVKDDKRAILEVRMDIANLESLDRIKTIAENELKMREAGPTDYRCIAVTQPNSELKDDNKDHNSSGSGLWARVSSWLGNTGATMAQNP